MWQACNLQQNRQFAKHSAKNGTRLRTDLGNYCMLLVINSGNASEEKVEDKKKKFFKSKRLKTFVVLGIFKRKS